MKLVMERGEVKGKIEAPSSKSFTHRALICAALANGKSEILKPLSCEDTEATRKAIEKLGCAIQVAGNLWVIEGGQLHEPKSEIFCRESGTTLRFLTAVCSLIDGETRLTVSSSLSKRPIRPLIDAVNELGASCTCNGEFPPVIAKGVMKGGHATLPGSISSQFVSALLLAAPMVEREVEVEVVGNLESFPYVLMTMETQKAFGVEISVEGRRFLTRPECYKRTTLKIEGDWSSAAFILALGLMAGETEVVGLNLNSPQADKEIIALIQKMGGKVFVRNSSIIVQESDLNAIRADVSNCPDLFPILAALCATARGRSEIYGIRRLRFKESDRVAAMAEGLGKMGAKVEVIGDSFFVEGSELHPAEIDPKGDHRIAMAFGVLGAKIGGVAIKDAECVGKSWPSFWDCLANLGVRLREGA
ncbi:MAG: 3-phosphoshikimate 1-carboxyvinyltransferase [Candidatus Bathyarchaeia archaeon]